MVKRVICVMVFALTLGLAGGASADLGTLSAWFPMDDNAATSEVNEAVGNVDATLFLANMTTPVNTNLWHSEDRKFGTGSLGFDGTLRVVAPDDAAFEFGSGSFSISLWMKTEQASEYHLVSKLEKISNKYYGYYIHNYDVAAKMRWRIYSAGTENRIEVARSLFCTGNWEHLCVVRNMEYIDPETEESAPRIEMWLNGSLIGTTACGSGTLDNTTTLRFAGLYTGLMDDIGLYGSALTEDEIEWVMLSGVGTPIPEPATMLLAGFGVLALLVARKRR